MHNIYIYIYIYINNILKALPNVPIHLHQSSDSLDLALAKVTKLLKLLQLQVNKSSKLNCSADRRCLVAVCTVWTALGLYSVDRVRTF
jgi:hypothetical protein